MNRLHVIQRIADAVKCKVYLEIGVNTGEIFFQVRSPLKIAVDPDFKFSSFQRFKRGSVRPVFRGEREMFFEKTSDDFFNADSGILKNGIDVAFIDGLHTYDQVMRDVQNTLRFLNPAGIIILHDCNPLNASGAWPVKNSIREVLELAAAGKVSGWNGMWNGDVWKAVVHIRAAEKNLNLFTLDLDWGLGILSRGQMENPLDVTPDAIEQMTYSDLEKNRETFLNLKPPSYLDRFLKERSS
jgi:hypothetical protein